MNINAPTFNWLNLPRQKEILENSDWKNLIVLDACRFDFFKDINTIEGNLSAIRSEGGHTYVVLQKLFNDFYPDIKIFSTHPVINSFDYTPKKFIPKMNSDYFDSSEENIWIATEHFKSENIIDIGFEREDTEEFNWGGKGRLNDRIIQRIKEESNFNKRNILWLMNPHGPLIKDGTIIERYIKTLKQTVKDVKKDILPRLDGKTIITSDHGECFFPPEVFRVKKEVDYLYHEHGFDFPSLRIVPWLEVK